MSGGAAARHGDNAERFPRKPLSGIARLRLRTPAACYRDRGVKTSAHVAGFDDFKRGNFLPPLSLRRDNAERFPCTLSGSGNVFDLR